MSRDGFEVHLWRLQVLVLHPNSLEGEIGAEKGRRGRGGTTVALGADSQLSEPIAIPSS
ncbi:hypothetical protein RLOC_00000133 [Lonchura striata]|uniref:Uncharacterized protein n=1 Tax=Lonchura striata TaxID=40157 RepID=A0A218UFN3_9PASE|nr:hypothetical protein RLOC_00000133 [Lonchura striata domestica]